MKLRATIAADVAAIMADSSEFGGTVTVDGVAVPGVLDEDTTGAAPRSGAARNVDGVYVAEVVLYVATGSIARPRIGQRMTVQGRRYSVVHSGESMGLLAVRLAEFEG